LDSGEFTENVREEVIINFDRFHVTIGSENGPQKYNLKMKPVRLLGEYFVGVNSDKTFQTLQALVASLKAKAIPQLKTALPCKPYSDAPGPSATITQDWIWPNFGKFFRQDDVIIVETGTSQVGFTGTALPGSVTTWTQQVFGSIGYATGATVGASVAHQEKGGKRTVLITGEGSLQLTVQAFADLLRHGTNPIV